MLLITADQRHSSLLVYRLSRIHFINIYIYISMLITYLTIIHHGIQEHIKFCRWLSKWIWNITASLLAYCYCLDIIGIFKGKKWINILSDTSIIITWAILPKIDNTKGRNIKHHKPIWTLIKEYQAVIQQVQTSSLILNVRRSKWKIGWNK